MSVFERVNSANSAVEQLPVPQEHQLEVGDYLAVQKLQPYATETMLSGDHEVEIPVLAEIADGTDTYLLSPMPGAEQDTAEKYALRHIARDSDGHVVRVGDSRVIDLRNGNSTGYKRRNGGHVDFFARGEGGFDIQNDGHDNPDKLTVSLSNTSEYKATHPERSQRRKARIKRGIAAVVAAATLYTPVSVEIDNAIHPGNVKQMTLDMVEQEDSTTAGEIARTMQDIEDGNLDAVKQRAETYRRINADQFPSAELVAETREGISEAKTHQQVADALNGYLKFYHKSAGFLDQKEADFLSYKSMKIRPFDAQDTAVKDTKVVANAIVNATDYLPKKLLDSENWEGNTNFDKILINNSSEAGGVQSMDEVVVGTESTLGHIASKGLEKTSGNNSTEWVVLHEIGHSFQKGEHYFSDIQFNYHDQMNIAQAGVAMAKQEYDVNFHKSPKYPSAYARTNGYEHDAEIFAGAFTPNAADWEGLSDPTAGKSWYKSTANRHMLEKLVDLDTTNNLSSPKAPFIDWLMAIKKGLIKH